MSSESALESVEDLENVPAFRMEDVQPRGRSSECYDEDEVLETFVVGDVYEECLLGDDDSNIGSMVSIKSEEVIEGEGTELIVPEVLEPTEVASEKEDSPKTDGTAPSKPNHPDSWPTLEILPGGVINLADKNDIMNLYANTVDRDVIEDGGDMMYACAKCSQSFKYLFCLVKHVKWHEDEAKKARQGSDLTKLKYSDHDGYVCLHSAKRKASSKTKTRKVPKKS